MTSDLSRVQGADVYLVFVESYGAVSFDRPALARPIAASRAQLDAAIRVLLLKAKLTTNNIRYDKYS